MASLRYFEGLAGDYICPMPTAPIPFALLEDHPALRAALTEYLCAQPECSCVLLAGSVQAGVALRKSCSRSRSGTSQRREDTT